MIKKKKKEYKPVLKVNLHGGTHYRNCFHCSTGPSPILTLIEHAIISLSDTCIDHAGHQPVAWAVNHPAEAAHTARLRQQMQSCQRKMFPQTVLWSSSMALSKPWPWAYSTFTISTDKIRNFQKAPLLCAKDGEALTHTKQHFKSSRWAVNRGSLLPRKTTGSIHCHNKNFEFWKILFISSTQRPLGSYPKLNYLDLSFRLGSSMWNDCLCGSARVPGKTWGRTGLWLDEERV